MSKIFKLLLDRKSPNGESLDPTTQHIRAIHMAADAKNEQIVALLILWYIKHGKNTILEKLALKDPLIQTMLQRYKNTKAAFMATWKSLEERGVAKDVRKHIIGEMLKESMFDPKWDISKIEQQNSDIINDNNSMGGSKCKLKRTSIGKKSIGKKLIKKNQIKRKKSMRKKT